MRTALLIIGSLLPIVSSFTYVVSILKGESKPQRMTRFLMVVITALATISLWANGDTSGLWLALTSLLQAVLILVLCWGRRGIGGGSRLDWACLGLCVVGIVLWLAWNQSLLGLLASIAADLVACIPSLHKTVRLPHTESLAFYALDTVAGLCVFLAGPFGWQAALFPLYIVLINAAFVLVIAFGRRRADAAPPTVMG